MGIFSIDRERIKMKLKSFKTLFLAIGVTLLSACTGIPEGTAPVIGFEKEKYLGKWYEIARLDHSFERGLEQVTAEYLLQEDGGIRVINTGYNRASDEWNKAEGKAYFVGESNIGHLKVSFFGPFYASYVILKLDKDYQYSLVTGPDRDYLWILSRTPTLDPDIQSSLIEFANSLGYSTKELIFVKHS